MNEEQLNDLVNDLAKRWGMAHMNAGTDAGQWAVIVAKEALKREGRYEEMPNVEEVDKPMTDPKIWNPADVRAAIKVAYEFTPYLDLLCKAVTDRGRLIAALETLGAVQPEVLRRLADPNSG